ncbi:MAG: pyridoxal phosphate-dependent aminotransferase [gamma proteobacterium symbiont of Bathyaustriella thionipta]|nr:pyridoxal phosphate-dependent aminotransferase [gamma proteobacterium symbiont of Bathyaustriella thionipta]
MERIAPFYVMDLLARARAMEAAGQDVVHMEIGEPDFITPQAVIEAGQQALANGKTHYTPALGLPALREAISTYYQERFDTQIAPERIIITPGASGALQLVMGVLAEAGRKVLLPDPGYPCNRNFVEWMGGTPVALKVDAASHYQPTAEQLSECWDEQTVALMLASPSNPTGTVIPPTQLSELAAFAEAHEGVLVMDEIYQGLLYEQAPATLLHERPQHFVINSFSKFFGMTGWRLGWLVAPECYVDAIERLAQNIFLAASTLSQYAALQAFSTDTQEILEQRREIFRQRRDFLYPALLDLGFDIPLQPEGAFYIYANSRPLANDSSTLCEDLLQKARVAVTPGKDFGRNQAQHHLRFAYTTDIDQLHKGVERIRGCLKKR